MYYCLSIQAYCLSIQVSSVIKWPKFMDLVIYTLAPEVKVYLLKLSFFSNFLWRKSCKIGWKIFCMKRGGNQSQSADLLCLRIKKQLYWKQMLTLCQLLKMESIHVPCSYKGVLIAVRILMDQLPT